MAEKKQKKTDRNKQKSGESPGLKRLKADLQSGRVGQAYLFYGEERFLLQKYLETLRKTLIPGGFEEFNYHQLDGKAVTVQDLADTLEGLPMMAERTLVTVTDLDLFRLGESDRERMIALLSDLPAYSCLVFVYDTLVYERNGTMKKLCAALEESVVEVEFLPAGEDQLANWVTRHFAELGKDIDRATISHLLFTCGSFMADLEQEIQKIGTYAKGRSVTRADIDAVAIPVLSATAFRLADAVAEGRSGEAAVLLGDLLKLQEEPIKILGALGYQLRKLYTARMALDTGKDRQWLMNLWGMRDYPARLLMDSARRTTTAWCADAVKQCQVLDQRLKSARRADAEGELKLLLARLGAQRR